MNVPVNTAPREGTEVVRLTASLVEFLIGRKTRPLRRLDGREGVVLRAMDEEGECTAKKRPCLDAV